MLCQNFLIIFAKIAQVSVTVIGRCIPLTPLAHYAPTTPLFDESTCMLIVNVFVCQNIYLFVKFC